MSNPIENADLCKSAEQSLRHGVGNLSNVPALIRRIIETRAWEEREVRRGKIVKLASLLELVTKQPIEGWGEDPKKIEAVIKDDPEVLAMWRKATTQQPHRPKEKDKSSDNVTTSGPARGNTKAYTLSRLERESPELFEEVKAGNLSANAAAIKAGFRKQKTADEKAIAAIGKCENKLVVAKALVDLCQPHERLCIREMCEV